MAMMRVAPISAAAHKGVFSIIPPSVKRRPSIVTDGNSNGMEQVARRW